MGKLPKILASTCVLAAASAALAQAAGRRRRPSSRRRLPRVATSRCGCARPPRSASSSSAAATSPACRCRAACRSRKAPTACSRSCCRRSRPAPIATASRSTASRRTIPAIPRRASRTATRGACSTCRAPRSWTRSASRTARWPRCTTSRRRSAARAACTSTRRRATRRTATTYPVFYLLHGAFDGDDSWSTVGRAGFIVDNLIAAGDARPMIVVMPDGHTSRFGGGGAAGSIWPTSSASSTPTSSRTSRARTASAPTARDTAIAGLSMGGAQTLDIAFGDLDSYGYVGVYSSGVFGIANNSDWESAHRAQLDDAALKRGLDARLVLDGQGRLPARHDEGDGRDAREARLRRRLRGIGRRPHVDQLARVPDEVRAAAVPLTKPRRTYRRVASALPCRGHDRDAGATP